MRVVRRLDVTQRGRRRAVRTGIRAGILGAALCMVVQSAPALDRLDFAVGGDDKDLTASLRAASLLLTQQSDGQTEAEDMFTAARSDYARILGALYAAGHYSGVINITIDGREASAIAPLDVPKQISTIRVTVDPGPKFIFGATSIQPLAPDTDLPDGFAPGKTAAAGVIEEAVGTATLAWREVGHAKVQTTREDIVADHARRQLSADVRLEPGPVLRFGPMQVKGAQRMEVRRIIKIAGLTEGERFSQSELDRAGNRLRRSGVFSSVTLAEGATVLQGGLLPIEVTVAEMKTRRYSIGAELSSIDGLGLSGYWLHRNLLGGAERLKVEGSITNIGSGESGMDYELGVSIDRPATITADTTATLATKIGHLDEVDYAADYAEFGLHFTQYLTDQLTARAGLSFEYVRGSDPEGNFIYRNMALPLGVTWDRRDSKTDARKGFYIDGGAKPFLGFGTTGSGVKLTLDARGYKSFGTDDRFTVAARLQGGLIEGSGLLETPRDDLFFSGGGGTVRGQPYRSLGVTITGINSGTDYLIGGTEFAAGSLELRARFGKGFGGVVFYDIGHVGAEGLTETHSGAGIGLRYDTGFGPIRLDIATPVSGSTGDGTQIYVGLGQSF